MRSCMQREALALIFGVRSGEVFTLVTDHLPLLTEDTWAEGEGAIFSSSPAPTLGPHFECIQLHPS